MTIRERIFVLLDGGIYEPHVIAAVLGLTTADVEETIADPEHTPAEPASDVGPWEGVPSPEGWEGTPSNLEARLENGDTVRIKGGIKRSGETTESGAVLLELPAGLASTSTRYLDGATKLSGGALTSLGVYVNGTAVRLTTGESLGEGDEAFFDGVDYVK